MLLYTKRAAPKEPKKRSRAGCVRCKQKKKKCNEQLPECQRCVEHGVTCEYEVPKTRKRDRPSFSGSTQLGDPDHDIRQHELWKQDSQQDYEDPWTEYMTLGLDSPSWATDPMQDQFDKCFAEYVETVILPSSEPGRAYIGEGFLGDVETVIRSPGSEDDGEYSDTVLVRHKGGRSPSRYPDLAMIAPSPMASPLREFSAPAYMEFSDRKNRRVLVDHFCNVLSHLIVFKEDTGNPFRQLVLPLSHSSSAVMDAIYALSSAHLEHRGIRNDEASLVFHNKALKGIARLIENDDPTRREEVLGAVMLLVYYEVLVQQGKSNIVQGHLKGALAIMNTSTEMSSPTSLFLERAFRFYDVVTALSLGVAPNTDSQSSTTPFNCSSIPPEINTVSESAPLSNVDVLLGLSNDLWPVIHRLSHLLSMKQSLDEAVAAGQMAKSFVLQSELENTSHAIEIALTRWAPSTSGSVLETNEPDSSSEDQDNRERARIQSILSNAEAYRHSALIYLYRVIRRLPCDAPHVQKHVHLSLKACSNVVASAEQCAGFIGPMAALLWPLFVAACEAITEEDKEMSLLAFHGTERRQGMRNITRAHEVVQLVWTRRDCGQMDVDWRDICREQDLNIVFG